MGLYMTLDAYPDVIACLERLRAGGKSTGILSNGTPKMLDAAVRSAGLAAHLDAVMSIEEVAVYKPDKRVYQLTVDRLSVAPARVCFVSTNAWDASGAAHFGFTVAWLNRFGKIPEKLPGALATTMTSLAELPELLGL